MKRKLRNIAIIVMLILYILMIILIFWEAFPVAVVVGIMVGITCVYALWAQRVIFSGRQLRVSPLPAQPPRTSLTTDIPLYLISALVARNVTESAFRVMLLSFVQRGFVVLDPDGQDYVILYLPGEPTFDDPIEKATWGLLRRRADANRELDALALESVRDKFRLVVYLRIKAMLYQKGWFDRRVREYSSQLGSVIVTGILLWFPFLATCFPTHSAWGVLFFVLVTAITFRLGAVQNSLPATTPEAEAIASPWRDFKQNLRYAEAYPDAYSVMPLMDNVDHLLLYILAVGEQSLPAEYYRALAERHYRPSWLGPQWEGYHIADVWTRFLATLIMKSEGGSGV